MPNKLILNSIFFIRNIENNVDLNESWDSLPDFDENYCIYWETRLRTLRTYVCPLPHHPFPHPAFMHQDQIESNAGVASSSDPFSPIPQVATTSPNSTCGSSSNSGSCSSLTEPFTEPESVKICTICQDTELLDHSLVCGYQFHFECITKWFAQKLPKLSW